MLLGTMVSHKYEVDHGIIFAEMDFDPSQPEKTEQELIGIFEREAEIIFTQNILLSAIAISFIIATILLILFIRKAILKRKYRMKNNDSQII